MIDTLNIGKYIYSRLSQIEGVKSYPLVADNDAKLPFIVYKRVNLESSGSKDGYYEDKVTMEVVVEVGMMLELNHICLQNLLVTLLQCSFQTLMQMGNCLLIYHK